MGPLHNSGKMHARKQPCMNSLKWHLNSFLFKKKCIYLFEQVTDERAQTSIHLYILQLPISTEAELSQS